MQSYQVIMKITVTHVTTTQIKELSPVSKHKHTPRTSLFFPEGVNCGEKKWIKNVNF